MEVHHHPQVEKKSFKEYLLEGLMIFLAVSMGFIAENIRENLVEHETEKRTMELVVENLKEDTTALEKSIKWNIKKVDIIDSILLFRNSHTYSKENAELAYHLILNEYFEELYEVYLKLKKEV